MLDLLDFPIHQIAFFISLLLAIISAIFLLHPKVPLKYIKFHIGILALPPIIAFIGLFINNEGVILGPWRFDGLSWLIVFFVLTIGLIVQRYSINYLLGDRRYRLYFMLLTLTTIADSLAWISNDLRLLLAFWGMTLLGLTILIKLNRDWEVTRKAARLSGRVLALSWLFLFVAILWVTQATGTWQLSIALTEGNLSQLASWEKLGINLLLIASVIIPAAQWPFQRWLLNSVVTPTPISAVMHAGIVNAGGILLTLFAPLFDGNVAQVILLILSSISVLIGTGIMLVQVDYKRQLVGSTIAQMGFMLIQCALGAYSAAITHAVLHGFFKSTLFLKAGSAISYHEPAFRKEKLNVSGLLMGVVLGVLAGIGYWLTSPEGGYHLISAVILGWSLTLAWNQLVSYRNGHVGRIVGISVFMVTAFLFIIIHKTFGDLLGGVIHLTTQPITPWSILLLLVLLAGSVIGMWFAHHRTSKGYAIMYLWLVRLGEPNDKMVENHPNYLTRFLSKGGPFS
ncbi:NADH-quinone oxidoreductase subunit L [Oceanobacillus arenosus]|uniref:Probable inorganic carbon transporter subunit DabB n=1 Tax=Oceanobacillus arenosus TaxID=1229153 RepID=A0A3D8Q039_9BACI|nr:NADH dehydrogenase subunit 5 [Oceanobacillus arenosus]RDW21412.1 NADH-quinone oxidoreductase subunit L [Oceanobacillus arenosus]